MDEIKSVYERLIPDSSNSLILFCSFVTLYDLCTRNKRELINKRLWEEGKIIRGIVE